MVSDALPCLPVARPVRPQTPGPIVGSGDSAGLRSLMTHMMVTSFSFITFSGLKSRSEIEIRGAYLLMFWVHFFTYRVSGIRVRDDKSQSRDS